MRQKNTSAKDIYYLTIPVNLTTIEHRFFFDTTGAKKKLGKKKRRQGISPLRRREGVRRLHPRELLKKLDQNFYTRQKRRLNAHVFEDDRLMKT